MIFFHPEGWGHDSCMERWVHCEYVVSAGSCAASYSECVQTLNFRSDDCVWAEAVDASTGVCDMHLPSG